MTTVICATVLSAIVCSIYTFILPALDASAQRKQGRTATAQQPRPIGARKQTAA